MRRRVGYSARLALAFAATTLALTVLAWSRLFALPITVDGRVTTARFGETVASVLARHGATPRPGDLLDLGGAVLVPGAGRPAAVYVNGARASLRTALYGPSDIDAFDGRDRREPRTVRFEPYEASPVVTGHGPFVRLVRPALPGVAEIVVGRVSGVATTVTLVPPRPAVYEKTDGLGQPVVALTFDDGPSVYTPAILRILRSRGVKATFFVIGRHLVRLPRVTQAAFAEGHTIGNHSFNHPAMGRLSWDEVVRELRATSALIESVTGTRTAWFRPPRRSLSDTLFSAARQEGLRVVLWDVDPQDWRQPGSAFIIDNVLSSVRSGSVVLLHDGGGNRAQTVRALPTIIDVLQARGYVLVPLDFFLRGGAKAP